MLTAPFDLGERVIQGRECRVHASRMSFGCCEQDGAKRRWKSDALFIVERHSIGHEFLAGFAIAGMPSRPTFRKRADRKPLRHRVLVCQSQQRLCMLTRMEISRRIISNSVL